MLIQPVPMTGAKQGDLKELTPIAVTSGSAIEFLATGRELVFCVPAAGGFTLTIAGHPSAGFARDEDHAYVSAGDPLAIGLVPSNGFADPTTGEAALSFSGDADLYVVRV